MLLSTRHLLAPSLLLLFLVAAPSAVVAQQPTSSAVAAQTPTYAQQAEQAFQQAEQAFANGNYDAAKTAYTYLRNRYPYSRYASLSEIRIGDLYFQQEQYASAIQQYRGFLRLYPNHPETPYAAFKASQAFFKGMPAETIFIFPPAHEIDLSKAELAKRELEYFLRRYPNSKYEKETRQALRIVERRLADHELYAAKFYMQRDNFRAGAWRLRHLLENYPGVGLDDQALILLAHCNIRLKDMKSAFNALKDLTEYHPNSPYFEEAKQYLEKYDH